MKKSPARLHRCNAPNVMEEQLTISVKELALIIFFVFLFFMIIIVVKPQTYGFL